MIKEALEVSREVPLRHSYHVLTKLMEEVGELAQEINIREGVVDKPVGKDGVIGEALDVVNCALDLIYLDNNYITEEEIMDRFKLKLKKWRSKCIVNENKD